MQQMMISDWVRSACEGDERAWNYLYHSSRPNLLSVALKLCGNTTAAKDSVQDAFMIAYLKLTNLKEPKAFYSWIERICIHCCYRAIQQRKSLRLISEIPYASDSWWENELDAKFDELSTKTRLFEVLGKLPDILRATLIMRYFTNYSTYDEIALILGIPVGTVRSRLNQAKQKMSEQWQQNESSDYHWRLAEEWNAFYLENFGMVHRSSDARNTFFNHLSKDLSIIFTSGKTAVGRIVIEKEIDEDLVHGSYFENMNVVTSDNVSVVEISNINSIEYPERCADSSILVLQRIGRSVMKVNLHDAPRG